MMCSQCGAPLKKDDWYCPECGAELTVSEMERSKKKSRAGRNFVLIFSLCLLIPNLICLAVNFLTGLSLFWSGYVILASARLDVRLLPVHSLRKFNNKNAALRYCADSFCFAHSFNDRRLRLVCPLRSAYLWNAAAVNRRLNRTYPLKKDTRLTYSFRRVHSRYALLKRYRPYGSSQYGCV